MQQAVETRRQHAANVSVSSLGDASGFTTGCDDDDDDYMEVIPLEEVNERRGIQHTTRVSMRRQLKRSKEEEIISSVPRVSQNNTSSVVNDTRRANDVEQNDKDSIIRNPIVHSPPRKGTLVPVVTKGPNWIDAKPSNAVIDTEDDNPGVERSSPRVMLIITASQLQASNQHRASKRPSSSITPSPSIDKRPFKRLKTTPLTPHMVEIQSKSCFSSWYSKTPRCVACISKKAGEPCRFQSIRAFKTSATGFPEGTPIWHGVPLVEGYSSVQLPVFNDKWYRAVTQEHVHKIKTSVAGILLSVLRQEREKLRGKESQIIQRKKEMDVRVTCDRCLTSIFSTSFICTSCGREICLDCYSLLGTIDFTNTEETRLITCGSRLGGVIHTVEKFLPVSRLEIRTLDSTIVEMARLLASGDGLDISSDLQNLQEQGSQPVSAQTDSTGTSFPSMKHATFSRTVSPLVDLISKATDNSDSTLNQLDSEDEYMSASSQLMLDRNQSSDQPQPDSSYPHPILLNETSASTRVDEPKPSPPAVSSPTSFPVSSSPIPSRFDHIDPSGVGSLPYEVFDDSELSEEQFHSLWRQGKTMVVAGLNKKMKIEWSPEYFIEHHGSETCSITDCENETKSESDVQSFFALFGKYAEREPDILKLKDWPPSSDFRTTFPVLFDDFQNAVPAPNYTRRDGFYNIAAHFPINFLAPDMGPKMYNAFKSKEEGFGSTRLHMDMADAVNIMLYSSPLPEEKVGVAVWDIYPSTASAAIRQFLKEEFPIETSPVQYVDPIHSQYFYLTPELRKKLFDRYQVRGWRIYQRPGDAVFIPAGSAHQVCNLADCIKVAVDFVSPENLDRCGQLTREFRSENDKTIWKEDILQLSNMCWSAWENTLRLEKEMALHEHDTAITIEG